MTDQWSKGWGEAQIYEKVGPATFDVICQTYISVLVILQIFCALMILFTGREDIVEQTFLLMERDDEIELLNKKVHYFSNASLAFLNFMDLCGNMSSTMMAYMRKSAFQNPNCKDALDYLFAGYVEELKEIFGYNAAKSHFNLAIYYRLPNTDTLKCVYSLRDLYFDAQKNSEESRDWNVGRGHVGQTFVNDVGDTVEDMTTRDYFWLDAKPGDEDFYRSAMSVPLRYVTNIHKPDDVGKPLEVSQETYGVMVLTSSTPGQFTSHHLAILRYLRKKLEQFIYELVSKETCNDS